jgi:hypothetical protein
MEAPETEATRAIAIVSANRGSHLVQLTLRDMKFLRIMVAKV